MRSIINLILALFILSLPLALFASNTNQQFDGTEVQGRIVVEFDHSLKIGQVSHQDGVALVGNTTLDALARQHRVFSITRLFPELLPSNSPDMPDLSHFYVLEFPMETDLHTILADYQSNSRILHADPDRAVPVDFIPNDGYYPQQWGLTNVFAPLAYDYTLGSPNVKVCIVDSGIDTAHQDLRDNLWVNPGEDINHNGIIELIEWNNMDDDANGYIDDFYGYNFWLNNNDVQDQLGTGGGHGTHCSGDISAYTNNGIGVASLGSRAKIITAKAGPGGSVYLTAAANGIVYAANRGAKVISLSFGGNSPDPYLPGSISYAWSQNALVFGAAGNSGSQTPHYPAAYDFCIAVAATNNNNQVAGFSNYGTWIDFCAPGQSIMSTTPNNGYESWDGTSMACPFAGGLAALVWAVQPNWTNQQVLNQIRGTCTNINAQNPGYIGLMGSGLINAGQAIYTLYPHLSYTEQLFNDSLGGDGDLRPDPGETVRLWLTLNNSSTNVIATNVTVTATCNDPTITLTQASSNFGNIPTGGSANNHTSPIMFNVSSTAPSHEATFVLTMHETGMNYTQVTNLVQMIGRPPVVLVDDDSGASFQTWYDMDLDSLNQVHDTWNVAAQGSIPLSELSQYALAVWHTSNTQAPLTTTEQSVITSYLAGGGHLFLAGENLDDQLRTLPFYANTLHATSLTTVGSYQLTGVPADPISNGTSLLLVGGSGAGNSYSPNCISPGTGASTVYTYNINSLGAGIKWSSGNSKLVYFAFNFEAASGIASTTQRKIVLNNILNWMGINPPPPPPQYDVTLTPLNPPIVVPAQGGAFTFNVALINHGPNQSPFAVWTKMKYPDGTWTGAVLGPVTINIPVNVTITRQRNQTIPAAYPPGLYHYVGYTALVYPSPVIDSSYFTFTKSATADGGPIVWDAVCSGELFPGETAVDLPAAFGLMGVSPNPFNPTTTISYRLQTADRVNLSVYDTAGRLVASLVNGWQEAGTHRAAFDGSNLSSGVYLYTLTAGSNVVSGKLALVK